MNFKTQKKTRRLERKVARRLQRKTHTVIAKFAPPKENCGMYHVYWPLPCFQISTLPKQYNCNRYVKLQYV